MTRNKTKSPFPVESRKTEVRYVTDDPKRMLGKFVARRAFKTWYEDVKNADTGETIQIERNDLLLERGTYIDQRQLSSISFMLQEGSLKEVEVSNQNRLGELVVNACMCLYKAVAKLDDKCKSFLLYATSVANALLILIDYIELNYKGRFWIAEVKEMDYCVVLIDKLKAADERKYELDVAYLKGEISMEDFAMATADMIDQDNPDAADEGSQDKGKKFYQIGAHIVMHDDKEGTLQQDSSFIVHTISAVRANMLIEQYLRDKKEERYQESLKHPDRTFVRYQITSCIEESKIIPVGCFIPAAFSQAYSNDNDS